MFRTFRDVITEVKKHPRLRLCVAAAADDKVLQAVKNAVDESIVEAILVGDVERIWRLCLKIGFYPRGVKVINESSPADAARLAVSLVGSGKADILMKGIINSSDFLRAVLWPESGLVTGNILSHLAVYEVPGFDRLVYMTDGGLNISPDLEQKIKITLNAVDFLRTIGLDRPRAALLSAELKGGGRLQSAVEAEKLVALAAGGTIEGVDIDGPMALDLAVNSNAAELWAAGSPIAGKADLLVVPSIEAGNVLGKTIIHFAGGVMAGLVLGASRPVVLTSRAETPFGKLSSIALACYYSIKKKLREC
ncbi:MAG: phosphate acyltransferase [Desulfocucumaceae bacterium]